MNLELNLKTKKLFENFSKYSKPTFEINTITPDKVCSTLYGMYSVNSRTEDIKLTLLSDIFNTIDAKDFAKETSMRAIYEFRELIAEFDAIYGENLRNRCDSDYHFEVTSKFNWKRGIYDNIKEYIDFIEKRYMRPSGMASIFNRIEDSRWYLNNFKSKAINVDEARKRAKDVCGVAVDNIEELMANQAAILQTILKSTNEANKISKYFDIFNFINTDSLSNNNSLRNYLDLTLYTIVVAHPQVMTIINNETTEICKLPVPKAYLIFKRPLYKVLANARYTIDTRASSPGGRHPYISSDPYYMRISEMNDSYNGNLATSNWGTLCLSNYNDDILNPLRKNDYESFVMGLSNWNNIYNIETTHPYKYPKQVFAMVGFLNPKDVTKKDDGTISWTSFNRHDCYQQNLYDCINVEDNTRQITYNRRITRNIAPYANYIVDSCDLKQCPLRGTCDDYKALEIRINSDYSYMIESLTGWLMENDADASEAIYRYQIYYTRYALNNYTELCYNITHILTEHGYWDAPLEENEATMEARVAQWSEQAILNEERRRHHGAN